MRPKTNKIWAGEKQQQPTREQEGFEHIFFFFFTEGTLVGMEKRKKPVVTYNPTLSLFLQLCKLRLGKAE